MKKTYHLVFSASFMLAGIQKAKAFYARLFAAGSISQHEDQYFLAVYLLKKMVYSLLSVSLPVVRLSIPTYIMEKQGPAWSRLLFGYAGINQPFIRLRPVKILHLHFLPAKPFTTNNITFTN